METLSSICKKDAKYKEMIKECYIVKNAINLLGGRRRKEGEREEEKGKMKEMECVEMRVKEKISLIELLHELVKGGVDIEEEEEMKEVLMELEEEGYKHVEEEIEGEGEEEKREWDELSEKARNLVWVMEAKKARREGKKHMSLKMKKEREEMEKKVEEAERGIEEANKKVEEEKRKREEAEERIERMKKEIEEMKKEGRFNSPPPTPIAYNVITSLDGTYVIFTPNNYGFRIEGNTIIRAGTGSYQNCFIGGEMRSV